MAKLTLQEQFGQIDIYLFDQLLKDRIRAGMRVLDAGCGGGRNLVYLLREGFEVFAVDQNTVAIDQVRGMARELAPQLPEGNFHVAPVERIPFETASFDVVISSAVLHFSRDDAHFEAMVGEMGRILRPGGLLFARLASSIGIEEQVERITGRRHRLPDGSERYLVDAALLHRWTEKLGKLADPLKTSVIENQRAMTTWVVRKS